MTKAEMIERVHKARGKELTKKQVTEIIDGVFQQLGDFFVKQRLTKGGAPKFTYPGFGTFTKKRFIIAFQRALQIYLLENDIKSAFNPGEHV